MQNSYDSATTIINALIAIHRDTGNIVLEDTFKAAYFQAILEDIMIECPQAFAFMQARLEIVKEMNMPKINPKSIELEDVDSRDYPDFCDAYISYAETIDGEPLKEWQLEWLNEDSAWVNELAHESFR